MDANLTRSTRFFLYKEDFEKFREGLLETLDKIDELNDSGDYRVVEESSDYSNVNFDDL